MTPLKNVSGPSNHSQQQSNSTASTSLTLFPRPVTNDHQPLESFLLFPELPPEIRLKVWNIILSTHRTITLEELDCYGKPRRSKCRLAFFKLDFRVIQDDVPPSLLSVNQESRFEALKIYSDKIPSEICSAIDKSNDEPTIKVRYFDTPYTLVHYGSGTSIPLSFTNTTFYLRPLFFEKDLSPIFKDFVHIRFDFNELLGSHHCTPGTGPYWWQFLLDCLKSLTSLRTLTFDVPEDGLHKVDRWWEWMTRAKWDNRPYIALALIETGRVVKEIEAGMTSGSRLFV